MSEEHIVQLINTIVGDSEKALRLIDENPGIIQEKTSLGETALHFLAIENELAAVKPLYEKGSDVNTVNSCGGTPLSDAASLGYLELVEFLLKSGARVDGLFSFDEPILHEAVQCGKPDIIHLLVTSGASIHAKNSLGETSLHASVADDKWLEVTKYIVEHGAKIDELDAFHCTPLHDAALHGAINTAKYLVQAGASLVIRDSKGRTPSQMARECDHNELAIWLEQTGHDQN